ncbi:MAG: hypothetical protein JHC26_06600 [Thermofilum sp.]|uniref:hypothetical protein n=1 Tax=Thermofilum sp. TaxID=1961369 RepID=UPI002590FBCE|nr:hypothetical protein [Thermofilum sp.]MCI4408743.1 hypothetical protein [Thermofilum sp.]
MGNWNLPEKLFKIEEGLRNIAASGNVPSPNELRNWHIELLDAAHECKDTIPGGFDNIEDLSEACNELREAAFTIDDIKEALHDNSKSASERMNILRNADKRLDEIEKAVIKVTGRPCRWSKELGDARLRYTLLINDVAACVHVLAQYMLEKGPDRVEGKCSIAKDADQEAIEVCKEWDNTTKVFKDMGMYSLEDAGELSGFVVDKKVQLRVGSASGHLAEIDLEKKTVKYYDTDWQVNDVIARLLEEYAGGSCKIIDPERGGGVEKPSVYCKMVDPKKAARVLATATSMDYRIGDRTEKKIYRTERGCIESRLADHFGVKVEGRNSNT